MSQLLRDWLSTTLGAALSNSATSMTVATGAGAAWPTVAAPDWLLATITEGGTDEAPTLKEIVKVTAHAASADAFTITRGVGGTTAQTFTTAAKVRLIVNAAMLRSLGGWELLAAVPALGAAAASMDSGQFTPHDELLVIVFAPSTSVAARVGLQFNNDTGNNYQWRHITSVAGGVVFVNTESANTAATAAFLLLHGLTSTLARRCEARISNRLATAKPAQITSVTGTGAQATRQTANVWSGGEWINTAAQINRVKAVLDVAGNYGIGSWMLVLGRDAADIQT